MINWTHVTGFDWDEGNSRKNANKHGVSQSEAETIFFNEPLLVLDNAKHSWLISPPHVLNRPTKSDFATSRLNTTSPHRTCSPTFIESSCLTLIALYFIFFSRRPPVDSVKMATLSLPQGLEVSFLFNIADYGGLGVGRAPDVPDGQSVIAVRLDYRIPALVFSKLG
jgi:hypothetical protein